MPAPILEVIVFTPQKVLFDGKATSVTLPGEKGVFEVMAFHKRIISRLVSGRIFVDDDGITIKRGVAKVNQNRVTVVIEEM